MGSSLVRSSRPEEQGPLLENVNQSTGEEVINSTLSLSSVESYTEDHANIPR